MNNPLHRLLQHPHIQRGKHGFERDETGYVSTGFGALDHLLPGGGWPRGQLIELIVSHSGIGELRLIIPALVKLAQEHGHWLAWIAPPYVPYAPALAAHNIDLSCVLIVHARAQTDCLWAVEQALRSGSCSAVLAWPAACDIRSQRRLQLAAEKGGTTAFLFYGGEIAPSSSFAALRLHLEAGAAAHRLRVQIIKCRGGWPCEPVEVALNDVMVESVPAALGHRIR